MPTGPVLWRGSSNQPLVPLTERGRARYADHVAATSEAAGKRMQAAIEGGRVWMIGIPGREVKRENVRLQAFCAYGAAEDLPDPVARAIDSLCLDVGRLSERIEAS